MAVDLTGGLSDDREFVFGEQPADPEVRESVNAWIWDSGDSIGFPRIGVEAVADQWETHDIQINVVTAGGTNFNSFAAGKVHHPYGADGRPRILGSGPLSFELIEPYRHWKMRIDGPVVQTTTERQIAGGRPEPGTEVMVQAEIDIRAAAPAWDNGGLLAEARRVLDEQDEGALMGLPRFEQLSRATGTVRVGESEYQIDGGALRVRRAGIRRLGTFRGHAWQSALFPDGRGFGYITYPPRDDGLPTYNEGYIFEGDGPLRPATVVDAPWLRRLIPSGEEVPVVLQTSAGTVRIEGTSILSNFMVMGGVGANPDWPVLQQAIVRYSWDGLTSNGMMERSTRGGLIEQ